MQATFNSLSRDHIGYLIGLLFLAFRVPFNSLSRDHEKIGNLISNHPIYRLSTPSLGITIIERGTDNYSS